MLTYQQLHREVCVFANVLKRNGCKKGDRVLIYMPHIPEAAIAMLACARIGAVHSVVFGGFSSESIKDRLADSGASIVITADGGYRRGQIVTLKQNVDQALEGNQSVKRVIVFRRINLDIHIQEGRDVWWHREAEYVSADCPAEPLDSEHPLFILYTSGSTGKPKGVLHTTGGYLLGCSITTKYVFDLHEEDTFWCTADVGWITGHSYVVYGPLANGATTLMYEGAPNWPQPDRFWSIIAHNAVTILYTAPTAIRAFMKWGDEWPAKHDLSSLRLLGTVGEPINPEAWIWYHKHIGGGRCPIVDTWWQTETGMQMITPLPGATPLKPGTATLPFFGIDAAVVDDDGQELGTNEGGKLVIRKPWPAMLRTIYGDNARYKKQYWSEIKGAISPETERAAIRMAISGSLVASMMCSMSRATVLELPRSKVPWLLTKVSPKLQWSAAPMSSKARPWWHSSRCDPVSLQALSSLKLCAATSAISLERSRGRMRFVSPTHSQKREVEKSCAACSRKSQLAAPSPATRRLSRTFLSLRDCGKAKSSAAQSTAVLIHISAMLQGLTASGACASQKISYASRASPDFVNICVSTEKIEAHSLGGFRASTSK